MALPIFDVVPPAMLLHPQPIGSPLIVPSNDIDLMATGSAIIIKPILAVFRFREFGNRTDLLAVPTPLHPIDRVCHMAPCVGRS
jgi:hypothetical protein